MREFGKLLILFGSIALVLGAAFLFADRLVGRLPGDIVVRRGPVTFYFPIATSVVVSIILTVLLNLFWRR